MNIVNKIYNYSFIRFVLVGIMNTIIGTSVMFACYRLFGMSYWLSSAMNYIVGSIFSYFANKYFTFKSRKHSLLEAGKFVFNISICYFIAYGSAEKLIKWLCINMLDMDLKEMEIEQIAMFTGMVFFVILNYIGQKVFVFYGAKEKTKEEIMKM